MYFRTNDDLLQGLGLDPITAIAAANLGVATLTAVAKLFSSGGFKTRADIAQFMHERLPPGSKFSSCTRRFRIGTYANFPAPLNKTVRVESFQFELQYTYNGNDLKEVRILPMESGSSNLYVSSFDIEFIAREGSHRTEPVAVIRYYISGTWDPAGSGEYKFNGVLDVRADGASEISITSESKLVRLESITGACPKIKPWFEIPKILIPRIYTLNVYFAPPGSTRIRAGGEKEIVNWYRAIPDPTKGKIESGKLPIILQGFASTTQSAPANRTLSRARANRVKDILQDISSSETKIHVTARGEYDAPTANEVEDPKQRRVYIFVQDLEMK